MGLLSRLSHVMKADAHGVVDALEDRRLLLRQTLREAELELDRKRARLEALGAELTGLGIAESKLKSDTAKLDRDVTLALEKDEEDLARFAVRRLLPLQQEQRRLSERRGQVETQREELSTRLEAQEQDFEHLKSRVRAQLEACGADDGTTRRAAPS